VRRAKSTASTPPITPTPADTPADETSNAGEQAQTDEPGEESKDSWKAVVGQADTWMDVLKQQEDDRKAEEARCVATP
jgi:hypothetical protein